MTEYVIKKIDFDLLQQFNAGVPAGTTSPPSGSLLVWWKFNTDISSTGNAIDSSGNGHDAVPASFINRPTFPSPPDSPSLIFQDNSNLFDGTSSALTVETNAITKFDFTDGSGNDRPFSVSFWVKPDFASSDVYGIIAKGDVGSNPFSDFYKVPYAIYFDTYSISDGRLYFSLSSDTSTSNYTYMNYDGVEDGVWQNFVCTYDGSNDGSPTNLTIKIYKDGVYLNPFLDPLANGGLTGDFTGIFANASDLAIANANASSTRWDFKGNIAQLSVWDKELTAGEVAALYNVQSTGAYHVMRNFDNRGSTATQTGSLDQLRQGVSVRTMEQRFGGIIPRFSAGSPPFMTINGRRTDNENRFFNDSVSYSPKSSKNISGTSTIYTPINDTMARIGFIPNHTMERRDLGQPKLFKDDEPFEDMPKWNPVQFMEDDGCTMIYPYILANVSMRDPDQMDGVIEPLAIRSRASRNSIDWPYEAHSVSGFLCNGAEDSRRRSNIIKQQIDLGPQSFEPFVDGGFEFFGYGQYQKLNLDNETVYYDDSVKWEGYLNDNPGTISPYVDATDRELAFEPLNSGLNIEIFNVVTSITGSIDDINDRGHKSATAGFVYFGAEDGTDSLAFGGLKK